MDPKSSLRSRLPNILNVSFRASVDPRQEKQQHKSNVSQADLICQIIVVTSK